MAERRDTHNMSERDMLSAIYNKVEILDDIVRGDPDRDMQGLQKIVQELKADLEPLKKAKFVRQAVITSVASLITVLASIATVLALVWQIAGSS